MAKGELEKILTFESLITPKLVAVFYWALTLMVVIIGGVVITRFGGDIGSTLVLVAVLVMIRIAFELVMVSFKNNEYLRRICEAMEANKPE